MKRPPPSIQQAPTEAHGAKIEAMGAVRFAILTLLGALLSALAGAALVYMAVLHWQAGEFSMKGGRMVGATTSPVEFYLVTSAGLFVGLVLLASAPIQCTKLFAPAQERLELAASNSKLYGRTRSSLIIIAVVLCVFMAVAWVAGK